MSNKNEALGICNKLGINYNYDELDRNDEFGRQGPVPKHFTYYIINPEHSRFDEKWRFPDVSFSSTNQLAAENEMYDWIVANEEKLKEWAEN